MKRFFPLIAVMLLGACAAIVEKKEEEGAPLIMRAASFSDLQGWHEDDFAGFMDAYKTSCARILKRSAAEPFAADPAWGAYGDWQAPCRKADAVNAGNPAAVRAFLEENFKLMSAGAGTDREGLFTGYYEATLKGSKTRQGEFQHPLLARPDDLVMVDLGEFRDELKGQRIAGRVRDGRLRPYENREQIVTGKLAPENFKPLVWLDNPYDAFFVQVQGSGIVHLKEGGIMRVGYAGQNGHPYYAIGRELVKRGIYSKDEVSMSSIRSWMAQNPDKADELMNTNRSYVFFTEMKDDGKGGGPQGGEGVKLTPGRSIAIDRSKMPYGFPLFLMADYADEKGRPIRKAMMAQDTGGAIRGAVRGDYFWGAGDAAEAKAGPMKAKGRYYFLLPRSIR